MPNTRLYRIDTAIVIFAYKRALHLERTIQALSLNYGASEIPVYIYIDAAKGQHEESLVNATCEKAYQAVGFKDLKVIRREQNLGLYASLTSGISEVLKTHDSVIVVEDDIITSPYFIEYIRDGLELYKDAYRVASIHGYTPPITQRLPETFFLRGADCWGWGTWKDRWAQFRGDAENMVEEIQEQGLAHEFDLQGAYPYLQMLKDRAANRNNSWAICWHASCFLADKLTLYPGKSLVSNIGLDFSGENCGPSEVMQTVAWGSRIKVEPIKLSVSRRVFRDYSSHFKTKVSTRKRILSLLKRSVRLLRPDQNSISQSKLTLIGPFKSYQEASTASVGYSSPLVVEKVRAALTKVIIGEASYERDGTAFEDPPLDLKIYQILKDNIVNDSSIVDFGGGLGGLYLNHRKLFSASNSYTVIEQASFVEAGKMFALEHSLPITFVESLKDVTFKPSILILSSVLPYIPDPDRIIQEAIDLQPEMIIIDRTAIVTSGRQKWWIQDEPEYYGTHVSYPVQPLNRKRLIKRFVGYTLADEWTNSFDAGQPVHRGFLMKRQSAFPAYPN